MKSPSSIAAFSSASALTLLLIAAGVRPSFAQTAAAPAPVVDSAKALVGTWEGSYVSDHASSGAMKLVIARDSSVLKITSFALSMAGEMQAIETRSFAVTPTDISWLQDMMGMACQATAVEKSAQMKGAIVCGHGSVTFTLNKRQE